jgi:glycosyltransferase involved in cell wall biosynthesis
VSSLLDQTFADFEIILVDDGSPDACPALCDAWAQRDPRIRVIHQENAGLSAARNAGIEAACGEWLMFVDSDDWVMPDFCATPFAIAKEQGVDLVAFDPLMVDEQGGVSERQGSQMSCEGLMTREEALFNLASERIYDHAWDKLYRRELFDDVRFPVGRGWEDQATTYRVFDKARRVFAVKKPLYCYRRREGSLTQEMHETRVVTELENRLEELAFLEKQCPSAAPPMVLVVARAEAYYLYHLRSQRKTPEYREVRKRFLRRRLPKEVLRKNKWALSQIPLRISPALFAFVCDRHEAAMLRKGARDL